jgi:uncharacterized protein with HEPN domain
MSSSIWSPSAGAIGARRLPRQRRRDDGPGSRPVAGFRNILVHGYDDVNLSIVADIVKNHLGDLVAFAASIRPVVDKSGL